MPVYVYHCDDCETEFEKMVRFAEADTIQICPTCQSQETRKKITTFASFRASRGASSSSSSGCGSRGGFG